MNAGKMKFALLTLSLLFLSIFARDATALQEVAGALTISVPVGTSNSAKWGLLNDGNQTVTVDLNSSSSVSQYLSLPQSIVLQPGNIVYITVTASIPSNYSGGNITGTLYALQEGNSGQVQMNVQLTKSITIVPTGQSFQQSQTTTSTSTAPGTSPGSGGVIFSSATTTTTPATAGQTQTSTTTPAGTAATSTTTPAPGPATNSTSALPSGPITGFLTFVSTPFGIGSIFSIIIVALILAWLFFIFGKRKKSNEIQSQPDGAQNQPGENPSSPTSKSA